MLRARRGGAWRALVASEELATITDRPKPAAATAAPAAAAHGSSGAPPATGDAEEPGGSDAARWVEEAVAAGRLKATDIDERALQFLQRVPASVGRGALAEFATLDPQVSNRSSFFMGLLKQRQAGKSSSDFARPRGRGSPARGAGRGGAVGRGRSFGRGRATHARGKGGKASGKGAAARPSRPEWLSLD